MNLESGGTAQMGRNDLVLYFGISVRQLRYATRYDSPSKQDQLDSSLGINTMTDNKRFTDLRKPCRPLNRTLRTRPTFHWAPTHSQPHAQIKSQKRRNPRVTAVAVFD